VGGGGGLVGGGGGGGESSSSSWGGGGDGVKVGGTAVGVAVGVLVGVRVGVAVGSGVGDGVKAKMVAVAPASVYSVTSGSSSDSTCISRPGGSVIVSVSVAQAATPSFTIRCVPSSLTWIIRRAGTLNNVTEQAGTTNSYEVS
jgi:hypothetical protein